MNLNGRKIRTEFEVRYVLKIEPKNYILELESHPI